MSTLLNLRRVAFAERFGEGALAFLEQLKHGRTTRPLKGAGCGLCLDVVP